MKAKEIFGLILRVVGLVSLMYGGWYLLSSLYFLTWPPEPQDSVMRQYFVTGVIYVIVALYLLRGAPHILRFAYGKTDAAPVQQDGAKGEQPSNSEANPVPEGAASRR